MRIDLGISSSSFIEQYQEKKPLLLRKVVCLDEFSWSHINEIFERSDVASDDFKLSFDGIRPKHEYVEGYYDIGNLRHRLIKPIVYEYLKKGATLIANKIKNEPWVSQFSRQIADFTGRQVVSSAYVAFGQKDSFRCHWDTRDVFAIQLIGRKRWIVYEPSLESPLYTQQSKDCEHLYPCPAEPFMDFVLEPGDVFYLPRGWWHNPLPLGEPTFHLALGTFPAYTMDYLGWAMKHMQEFLGARQSLANWEKDRDTLASVGQHLDAFINDRENYSRFMDEFTGAIRVESPLALEMFGDPNAAPIPDHASIRLSANQPHGLADGYVIANGTKLKLDEQGIRLIRCISDCPGISLSDLSSRFPAVATEKLHQLVTELCRQDILELHCL